MTWAETLRTAPKSSLPNICVPHSLPAGADLPGGMQAAPSSRAPTPLFFPDIFPNKLLTEMILSE